MLKALVTMTLIINTKTQLRKEQEGSSEVDVEEHQVNLNQFGKRISQSKRTLRVWMRNKQMLKSV